MTIRKTNCPACAGPVVFSCRTSLVAVCGFCQTAIARGDKSVEDHGKVADLVATQSPLKLGLRGKHAGKPFLVVGRTQFQHSAGGVWDEWFCQFPQGKWGWLAEAQGRFYLTFEKKIKAGDLPAIASLQVGSVIATGAGELTVAEVGIAKVAGAEGEMPFALVPNSEHVFADLAGPDRVFATLEETSGVATIYVGTEVSLFDIGLSEAALADAAEKTVGALKVSCPNCAGSLELQAPGETQRVTCPFCAALLDCERGNLKYLSTLQTKVKPTIALGTEGQIDGQSFMVIGYMQRSVTFDKKYKWGEYLLYRPRVGFRWLVESDSHWSFVQPLSPGEVKKFGATVAYGGQTYRLFQDAVATVEYVLGEFYWKVEVNEAVQCRDFIAPPLGISIETTVTPRLKPQAERDPDAIASQFTVGEVSVSLSRYMTVEEVEAAFGVSNLPRSWGVAPNQPRPCPKDVYVNWLCFVVAATFIFGIAKALSLNPDIGVLITAMIVLSSVPLVAFGFNQSTEQRRWAESQFSPYGDS